MTRRPLWQRLYYLKFVSPSKTGLIRIGNPDRSSLVFLTCNYHLTLERVKRALEGIDCYLLVSNSRGVNVWCAATGGLFTNHDVVSVLKTSGIEELVDQRIVVLPLSFKKREQNFKSFLEMHWLKQVK